MRPLTTRRLHTAVQRRLAKWLGRRMYRLPPGPAIISFSFDDFPRSALLEGGAILEDFGVRGTYYASLGLAGTTAPTGTIFNTADLVETCGRGHELGCHTFDHCPAWETPTERFDSSMRRNADALRAIVPGARFRSLSYPISHPRPATKCRVARSLPCARGGGQRFNRGEVDLNYLDGFFLEQSRDNPDAIRCMIEATVAEGGWLIFATHDVTANPTRYGCPTSLFHEVVRWAATSGAVILPVAAALESLNGRKAALAAVAAARVDPVVQDLDFGASPVRR